MKKDARGVGTWLGTFVMSLFALGIQAQESGATLFTTHCASCHGTDGNGGELGPNIATRVPLRSDEELIAVMKQGLGAAGMPGFAMLSTADTSALVETLRALTPRFGSAPEHRNVALVDGTTLPGLVLNQSAFDLQLLGDDRKLHVLRTEDDAY